MGQKVNPKSMRLKINELWSSKWFGRGSYGTYLIEDSRIRTALKKKLREAAVAEVVISRDSNKVTIDIHSGRPGVIIGRGGAGSEDLKKFLAEFVKSKIQINIIEVKKPDSDAAIIGANVATQVEKRIPYRRAMKQSLERAKSGDVKGIKIQISGRLNGADIARSEKLSFGTVPLSTFESDIDFSQTRAETTFGTIGIKVWVYKGERKLTAEDFIK